MFMFQGEHRHLKAVGALFVSSALLSMPVSAEWEYVPNIDPMTDENKSVAMTSLGRNESAIVRCDGKDDYEVLFGVGEYLSNDQRVPVQFRVDEDEPSELRTWSLSTDGTAVFAPLRYKEDLIRKMKKGNQITVQITDYQGSKPFSTFSLSGSATAMSKLPCLPK